MIKILFVIPEYSHGGTNKSLENLLSLLDKDKYDISIYSLYEDGGDYYKEVFKPYIIKKSSLYYWLHDNVVTRKFMGLFNKITRRDNFTWLYRREANLIQNKHKYDTIVAYQEGPATQFVSYVKNVKQKIAWIHCDYNDWSDEKQRKKDESVYFSFKNIVCVSETARQSFCKVFPQYKDKSISVYNTLNCEKIINMSFKEVSLPAKNGKRFSIISVGRLSEVKQFDKIPSIVKSMGNEIANKICWYIIGAGSQKEYIEKEIRLYHLEDTVIMLGAKDNPYPYFKSADLYVCTSDSESFSYTIFESKILHTPVLSNNFPVAYEVLDKNCGWVCPIDEMPSLLSDIINDNMGIYSQVIKSIKNYNYDNKNIIKIVESIIN